MAQAMIPYSLPVVGFDIDYGIYRMDSNSLESESWGVCVVEDIGLRHTHAYTGRMTEAEARRLCMRVRAAVRRGGIDALDPTMWHTDIVYGSVAYQQEEPWIVEREKADALLFG